MAEYEVQPTVVLQKNEVLNHTLEKWSFRFESILGSEKQFTETKWNFRFRTVAG
jgi:hypothetical protein